MFFFFSRARDQRITSESPWGIEPQTFGFHAHLSLCGSVVGHPSANPKVWGSIPHGDSEFFLCPTLVTLRKTSFSISLPSTKLTISLILGVFLWQNMLSFSFRNYDMSIKKKKLISIIPAGYDTYKHGGLYQTLFLCSIAVWWKGATPWNQTRRGESVIFL